VYDDRFLGLVPAARESLLGALPQGVVVVDEDGAVRRVDGDLPAAFRDLAVGESLEATAPSLAGVRADGPATVTVGTGGETRHLRVTREPVTVGENALGAVLLVRDVTERAERGRELERLDAQREDVVEAASHELRNALALLRAELEQAGAVAEDGGDAAPAVARADASADRLSDVVDDLTELVAYGGRLSETRACDLRERVGAVRETADADVAVTVDGEATLSADPERLDRLLENALRFAAHNGATTVRVVVTADGFAVVDDGHPVDPDRASAVFQYGAAVPSKAAGMTLPNVRTLARVHGWDVAVDPSYRGGVRYEVRGVGFVTPPTVGEDRAAADD